MKFHNWGTEIRGMGESGDVAILTTKIMQNYKRIIMESQSQWREAVSRGFRLLPGPQIACVYDLGNNDSIQVLRKFRLKTFQEVVREIDLLSQSDPGSILVIELCNNELI